MWTNKLLTEILFGVKTQSNSAVCYTMNLKNNTNDGRICENRESPYNYIFMAWCHLSRSDPLSDNCACQGVNDVLQERFAIEMRCNTALRLAALHIQERLASCGQSPKTNLKIITWDTNTFKMEVVPALEVKISPQSKGRFCSGFTSERVSDSFKAAAPLHTVYRLDYKTVTLSSLGERQGPILKLRFSLLAQGKYFAFRHLKCSFSSIEVVFTATDFVFLFVIQENLGNWELCVIHFIEKHARERPEEGHQLPHEEEPVSAWSQTEGSVCWSGAHELSGGAEWPQVIWREILQCHNDGKVSDCVFMRHF